MCSWHPRPSGQCSMASVQERADAGSVPSSGSVAWPEKVMRSPTFHVNDDAGVSMTGEGEWFVEAVVNDQFTSAARACPARSFAPAKPPLTLTEYTVLGSRL